MTAPTATRARASPTTMTAFRDMQCVPATGHRFIGRPPFQPERQFAGSVAQSRPNRQNGPMTRDELFIDLAVKAKFLTPAQREDCRKLREMLNQNAFSLTLSEIIAKKEYLNPDQLRLINVAIRYEELKREDEALGGFIAKKGFLPKDKIDECLSAQ